MMIEVHVQHQVALICLTNHYLLLLLAQVLVVALGLAIVLRYYGLHVKHWHIEEAGPVQPVSACQTRQGLSGRVAVFSVPEPSML